MKNPKAVAQRIVELHNEGVRLSVKRVEDTKRSVEEASTVGEKVIWLVENTVEDASARTTEETIEFGHTLLEFAEANANAYFDWLHEAARVKSPLDFIAVCMKHSQQQFKTFRQQNRELVSLVNQTAIENMGPLGTFFGSALIGSSIFLDDYRCCKNRMSARTRDTRRGTGEIGQPSPESGK